MNLTIFQKVVLILSVAFVSLLSYSYIVENGLMAYGVLLCFAVPLLIIMYFAFRYTKPDSLANHDHRYSKQGREEWDERNKEFMDSTKE